MRMFVRRPTRGCCRIRLLWPLSVSRKKHVSKLAVRTQSAHNIKKGRVMEGAARLSKAPPKSASEGILSCRRTPPAAERWLEYHRRGAATVRGA